MKTLDCRWTQLLRAMLMLFLLGFWGGVKGQQDFGGCSLTVAQCTLATNLMSTVAAPLPWQGQVNFPVAVTENKYNKLTGALAGTLYTFTAPSKKITVHEGSCMGPIIGFKTGTGLPIQVTVEPTMDGDLIIVYSPATCGGTPTTYTIGQTAAVYASCPVACDWSLSGNSFTAVSQTPVEYLGTQTNHDIVMKTASIERMRLTVPGSLGLGTATPHSSAMMQVVSPSLNKGVLIPNIPLQATNNAAPVTSPANSLLVYNTATAGTPPYNVVPGYYYWDGSKWVSLSGGSGGNDWSLAGNSLVTGNEYIGTNSNNDWVVKTQGNEKMRITTGLAGLSTSGRMGLGTSSPAALFHAKYSGTNPMRLEVATSPATNENNSLDVIINSNGILGPGSAIFYLRNLYNGTTLTNGDIGFATQNAITPANSDMKMVIKNSGNVGIGTVNPANKLEINGVNSCTSGLRFSQLNSNCSAPVNASGKVLSVDGNGDVVLVADAVGGGGSGTVTTCTNPSTPTLQRISKFSTLSTNICDAALYEGTGNRYVGVDEGFHFSSSNLPIDRLQVVKGNVRIGEVPSLLAAHAPDGSDVATGIAADYGRFLHFSGAPASGSPFSDNSDPLWIARKYYPNSAGCSPQTDDRSQLRINIGNDTDPCQTDLLSVGTTLPGATNGDDRWRQHMVVASNGNTGIGSNFGTTGSGIIPDFSNIACETPSNKLEILGNSGAPQMRITYNKLCPSNTSIFTDFLTDAAGNMNIHPSGAQVRIQSNIDITGTTRAETLPPYNPLTDNWLVVSDNSINVLHNRPINTLPYLNGGNNGLTPNPVLTGPATAQWGQELCTIGNPAMLLHSTEIPMNDYKVIFSPSGAASKGVNDVGIGMPCTAILSARLDVYNDVEPSAGQFKTVTPNSPTANTGVNVQCQGSATDNVGVKSYIPASTQSVNNTAYSANITGTSSMTNVGFDCDITGQTTRMYGVRATLGNVGTATEKMGVTTTVSGGTSLNNGFEAIVNGTSGASNNGVSVTVNGATSGTNSGLVVDVMGSSTINIGSSINVTGTSTAQNFGSVSVLGGAGSTENITGLFVCNSNGGTNNYGVKGQASGSALDNYGLKGYASGATAHNYGVKGDATGGFLNYAVYGNVSGTGNSTGTAGNYAGYFNGDVFISGQLYSPSDINLKKDIQPLTNAFDIISKLNPKTYNFKTTEFDYLRLSKEKQFGLISQEVEKIVPEAVEMIHHPQQLDSEGKEISPAKDILGLNYTMFIPILIQGAKEQNEKIDAQTTDVAALKGIVETQQSEIAQLKQQVAEMVALVQNCCSASSKVSAQQGSAADDQNNLDQDRLDQNVPNPFSENTIIRYYLNRQASGAYIRIMTLEGIEVASYPITSTGNGQILISNNTLTAGTYFYELVVNGKKIDAKKMILTK